MSDELIEGRSLRRNAFKEDDEYIISGPLADMTGDPLTEELPFIVLEPPPEAGDYVGGQLNEPTRPTPRPRFSRGLDLSELENDDSEVVEYNDPTADPVEDEIELEEEVEADSSESPSEGSDERDEPSTEAEEEQEEPEVQPIMRLPKLIISDEEMEVAPKTTEIVQILEEGIPTEEQQRFRDITESVGAENPQPLPVRSAPVQEDPEPEDDGIPESAFDRFNTTSSELEPVVIEDEESEELDVIELEVKRPEDTNFDAPVVTAELMINTEDDLEPVHRGYDSGADARARLTKVEEKSGLSVQQIGLIVIFLLITVLIAFVPGLLSSAISKQNATEEPPVDVADDESGETGSGTASTRVPTNTPSMSVRETPIPNLGFGAGEIAYSSNLEGSFDIFLLDTESRENTNLTGHMDSAERQPAWSPDENRIAFVSDRDGNDDIFVMNADGSLIIQVTDASTEDRAPVWAPDGDSILFTRETADGSLLYVIPAECIDERATCENVISPVTDEGFILNPSWAPNGLYVAVTTMDFPGLPSSIGLYDLRGAKLTLLEGTGASDFYPAWSPEGDLVAFVALADVGYDIWAMTTEGENLTQLTFDPGSDVEPAWTSDGNFILFASDRDGDFEIYLQQVRCPDEGTACEMTFFQLTDNASDDLNPAWRP